MNQLAKLTGIVAGLLVCGVVIEGSAQVPARTTTKTATPVKPSEAAMKQYFAKLTLQRGQSGKAPLSSLSAKLPKVSPVKPVDFSLIRPGLAKLLSVSESSIPTPVQAPAVNQPGDSVRISLDQHPQGGLMSVFYAQVTSADDAGVHSIFSLDSNTGLPTYVYAQVPTVGQAMLLLTCYVRQWGKSDDGTTWNPAAAVLRMG